MDKGTKKHEGSIKRKITEIEEGTKSGHAMTRQQAVSFRLSQVQIRIKSKH